MRLDRFAAIMVGNSLLPVNERNYIFLPSLLERAKTVRIDVRRKEKKRKNISWFPCWAKYYTVNINILDLFARQRQLERDDWTGNM